MVWSWYVEELEVGLPAGGRKAQVGNSCGQFNFPNRKRGGESADVSWFDRGRPSRQREQTQNINHQNSRRTSEENADLQH